MCYHAAMAKNNKSLLLGLSMGACLLGVAPFEGASVPWMPFSQETYATNDDINSWEMKVQEARAAADLVRRIAEDLEPALPSDVEQEIDTQVDQYIQNHQDEYETQVLETFDVNVQALSAWSDGVEDTSLERLYEDARIRAREQIREQLREPRRRDYANRLKLIFGQPYGQHATVARRHADQAEAALSELRRAIEQNDRQRIEALKTQIVKHVLSAKACVHNCMDLLEQGRFMTPTPPISAAWSGDGDSREVGFLAGDRRIGVSIANAGYYKEPVRQEASALPLGD